MMLESNPFQELYVTDSPDPAVFVRLFSPLPVRDAAPMFLPGNVVLKGTQGAGKSMLLNLLRPEIRLAYFRANLDGHDFPVPNECERFIGAGINLTKSGALDLGQRPLSADPIRDCTLFPLYFADFLNYFIVRDILESITLIRRHPDAFSNMVHASKLDSFARELAHQDCWFNYLHDCTTLESLIHRIDDRNGTYRRFHAFNLERMPEVVDASRTSIGEPIARTAELLRDSGAVDKDVQVFVRIDQVERLVRSDVLRPSLGREYRRIINKALGLRDARVSYRIGTRQYAWEDDLTVFGTSDRLEHLRDYRVIDLDLVQRRQEDTKTWTFPKFAEDAMIRRLKHAGYVDVASSDVLGNVFGPSIDPERAATLYAKRAAFDRAVRLDQTWSEPTRSCLESLFAENPMSALLAVAWARQKGTEDTSFQGLLRSNDRPWERKYWRKERMRQALVQLAARSAQRLKWWGKDHILALSGGNITVFLSLCHEIWEAHLRSQRRNNSGEHSRKVPSIHPDVQAAGIQTASTYWYEKIPEQPNGTDRQRFIDVVGALFRKWLLEDLAMSYPGRNGFSLIEADLESLHGLHLFLTDAAAYGDLFDTRHTTKERDRRPRRKWYLNPILSPHFQVPESHVKEPFYATLDDVIDWLVKAEVVIEGVSDTEPRLRRERPSRGRDATGSLFFDESSK